MRLWLLEGGDRESLFLQKLGSKCRRKDRLEKSPCYDFAVPNGVIDSSKNHQLVLKYCVEDCSEARYWGMDYFNPLGNGLP